MYKASCLRWYSVAELLRALASQAEGWNFESRSNRINDLQNRFVFVCLLFYVLATSKEVTMSVHCHKSVPIWVPTCDSARSW